LINEQGKVLLRMRDVAFALRVAAEHGQSLNRIRLQKFVYLVDVLCRLFDTFPPRDGHVVYRHGPYDKRIQNAVDALAFRGLVKIVRAAEDDSGNLSTEYTLTNPGQMWVSAMLGVDQLLRRHDVAAAVGEEIERRGWHRLKELVYAEPTFVSNRPLGYGRTLKTGDVRTRSSGALLALSDRILGAGFENPQVTPRLLTRAFFDYLEQYTRISH
jgi:hypothetical protein